MNRLNAGVLMGIAVWIASAGAASAQVAFARGDVFASIGFGLVNVYGADGLFKQTLNTGVNDQQTAGSAFDPAGNFYVTNFLGGQVFRFDVNGVLRGGFPTGGNAPESLVFDAAGNMFVGHANGPNNQVRKLTAAGAPIAAFAAAAEARGTDWVELAANQTTVYYTSEGLLVKRFDTAANTQLPDFAALSAGPAFALRLLADGGLLVANNLDIKRLSSAGVVIQTYDVPLHDHWFSLNLDPDTTSFWSADFATGKIHKFDIATGALLQTIDTGFVDTLFGITVFGEPTQGASRPPAGPAATTLVTAGTGVFYGVSSVSATLASGGSPVAGATISFVLNGSAVGSAVTDSTGVATITGVSLGSGGINAGLHPGLVQAAFAGNASLQATSAIGDLSVTRAPSTIVWPQPAPIVVGTRLSATQLNAQASFSGPLFYSPPIGTLLPVGTHTLSVDFEPNNSVDYAPAFATVTLTVLPPPKSSSTVVPARTPSPPAVVKKKK